MLASYLDLHVEIDSECRLRKQLSDLFVTYHMDCNKNNTTSATRGAGTGFNPGIQWVSCCLIYSFLFNVL